MSADSARQVQEAIARPGLEQRVAALEATLERLTQPFAQHEWTDEQIARFKEEFEAAAKEFPQHEIRRLPSSPTVLDPAAVRQLLRESVTAVKPGEVLFFTCGDPNYTPMQIREIQDWVERWLADNAPEVRAMVLPHGEFAAGEPETDQALARRLERVLPGVLANEMRRKAANFL